MRFGSIMCALIASALLACGPAAQAAYIAGGDGTVTDNGTGLMWQQVKAPGPYTWRQALAYCEGLELAGYTDWRLPTVKELLSITDFARQWPPVNTNFFLDNLVAPFWTSTTSQRAARDAWYVYFNYGFVGYNDKSAAYFIRAVRTVDPAAQPQVELWPVPDTGQTAFYTGWRRSMPRRAGARFYGQDACYQINTPAYTKLADNCTALADNATSWAMVRDSVTGLVWEHKHGQDNVTDYASPNDADNSYTWYDNDSATNGGSAGTDGDGTDTSDFISDLNAARYGGYADWRLPTVHELESLIDYGADSSQQPALNTAYFASTPQAVYWSANTSVAAATAAWYVDFGYNQIDPVTYSQIAYAAKSTVFRVRAVRSGGCDGFSDLLVSKTGAGSGSVTSDDGTIDCGAACTHAYASHGVVTLTAKAAWGSTFAGWSGGGCAGTDACAVTLDSRQRVTATFSRQVCPAEQVLGQDSPQLEPLRAFRDTTLSRSALGRKLIELYYGNAGSISAALDRSPLLKSAAKRVLEAAAQLVGEK